MKGTVVVITGAARGIGRALTEGFLSHEATVVAIDRTWEGVEDLRERWEASGAVMAANFDVTNRPQVAAVAAAVAERYGHIGVLVNNVGLRIRDLYPETWSINVLEATDDDWHKSLGVHVIGTLNVTRAFVPLIKTRGRGSIINIGSQDDVELRNSPYAATKAALTSVSRYLAAELRDHNIAVNVVLPGGTMTTGAREHLARARSLGLPTGPLLRPEHVLPIALHLAEQDATTETGRILSAPAWNQENGLGDIETWLAPDMAS